MSEPAILFTDGASFGNPGPSGIGFVLQQGDEIIAEHSEDIGWGTNNQAEYRALLSGLKEAIDRGIRNLDVRCDSQLIVNQVNGEYKVKDAKLKGYRDSAQSLVSDFDTITFTHIRRHLNERADELSKAGAEKAMARGVTAPQQEIFE